MNNELIELILVGCIILMPLIFAKRGFLFSIVVPIFLLLFMGFLTGKHTFYRCTDFCIFMYLYYFGGLAISLFLSLLYKIVAARFFKKSIESITEDQREQRHSFSRVEKFILVPFIAVACLDLIILGLAGLSSGYFYGNASPLGLGWDILMLMGVGLYFIVKKEFFK